MSIGLYLLPEIFILVSLTMFTGIVISSINESMLENAQTIIDGVYVGYCRDDICTYLLPVADVVQIVRCKDCAIPHNQWTGCPKLNGLVTSPDFYCSYGERKNEDD